MAQVITINVVHEGIEITMTDGITYALSTDAAVKFCAGMMKAVNIGLDGMLAQRISEWGFEATLQLMTTVQSKGLITTDLGMTKTEVRTVSKIS